MSNNNNQSLADYLAELVNSTDDIKNAIIDKGGTVSETDGLTSLASAIATIPSGGGGGSYNDDVRFLDYDGTVVQSYSAADFANLSALPDNPTHTGLTAQGWNWSLADAKAYVASYGKLNIGQMYITSDGKTRFYYVIPNDSLTLELHLNLDEDTELDVDWGDGTEHTTWPYDEGSSISHPYANGGKYIVAITVVRGGFSCQSSGNEDFTLKKVELGSNVTSIDSDAFSDCYSLSSVTIPNSVTSIGSNAFYGCSSLSSITIPDSVTSIGSSAFSDCSSLSSITIPDGVTSIGSSTFYQCYSLSSITIPSSVTSIGNNAFYQCSSLSSVTIPNTVTSIGSSAFVICSYMSYIKFESTTPPTVSNSNAWNNVSTSTLILVPVDSYDAYKTSTNYPNPSTFTYFAYGTYTSGDTLPATTSDNLYNLTWYASMDDAVSQTNPITVGNGNEVYARAVAV